MFEAALSLSTEIGYDSAGTVEFMYDPISTEFYFLEMNTRLQVEHPVTEAVTGIDLVQWQIRIALGEQLSFRQEDIPCVGWAMEARITAEDPAENYMPATGIIQGYKEPSGASIRVDSGIVQGSEVSHYYDSMLAKVIVSAENRNSAIRRLKKAIDAYIISGIQTNSEFLIDILGLDEFVTAGHHTGLLEQAFPDGWRKSEISQTHIAEASLAWFLFNSKQDATDPWSSLGAWRVGEPAGKSAIAYFTAVVEGRDNLPVTIQGRAGNYAVTVDGEHVLQVRNAGLKDGQLVCELDGLRISRAVTFNDNQACLQSPSGLALVRLLKPEQVYLERSNSQFEGGNQITAPMPGLIVDILAKKGEQVAAGDTLVVLEAMKLMQKLVSPATGIISGIHFSVGDTPEKGAILISIDPENKIEEEA